MKHLFAKWLAHLLSYRGHGSTSADDTAWMDSHVPGWSSGPTDCPASGGKIWMDSLLPGWSGWPDRLAPGGPGWRALQGEEVCIEPPSLACLNPPLTPLRQDFWTNNNRPAEAESPNGDEPRRSAAFPFVELLSPDWFDPAILWGWPKTAEQSAASPVRARKEKTAPTTAECGESGREERV